MKQWLTAFGMCQSMFCAIPCPWNVWDEQARDKMLLCLPVVGLEMGLLWWALACLCSWLGLPMLVKGLVLSMYPYLVSGFIHLDGFMDVTDAVKSWRSLERRREILKDSHVGSFSVIGCGMLLIAQFALLSSVKEGADLRILIFIPVVSRCCSSLAVLLLKPMTTSQYADTRRKPENIALIFCQLLVALVVSCIICGKYMLVLLGGTVGFLLALRRAYRSLEGMNGDISGYSMTYSELAAVAVLALM